MDNIDEFNLEVKDSRKTYFLIAVIVLATAAAFGLGRLSKIEEGKVPIEFGQWQTPQNNQVLGAQTSSPGQEAGLPSGALAKEGKYVGSRNSTKYHFPWCPGALRIKEENKIWFDSKESAEVAGYSPAANCKGL